MLLTVYLLLALRNNVILTGSLNQDLHDEGYIIYICPDLVESVILLSNVV